MSMATCPLCEHPSTSEVLGDKASVQCSVCVSYVITGSAEVTVSHWPRPTRMLLSGHVRRHLAFTGHPLVITTHVLDDFLPHQPLSVRAKQNALLLDIARRSGHPGARVTIESADASVVDATTDIELNYLFKSLIDRQLLRELASRTTAIITPAGWEHVDALRSPRAGSVSDIFVAMSFSTAMWSAWDQGIKPGIEQAGYRAKRVDSDAHNDKIDDRIIAGIRASYAVVVDVTTQNRGAYFEAGFAMGLGRPVVWTVRSDDLDNLHFDTRQFSHVVWDNEIDLKEKLCNHLLAVFGRAKAPSEET